MTSEKKVLANRRNGAKTSGPRTETGKRNSKRNALKTGLYARELYVRDEEQVEFDALVQSLRLQFRPETPMQEHAFELIGCCCWRVRLALRLEAFATVVRLIRDTDTESSNYQSTGQAGLIQWVGCSSKDLGNGIKFLQNLRADVATFGPLHLEQDGEMKDSLIKGFGQAYYDTLIEWKDMSPSAIQLAMHLALHAETFPKLTPLKALEPGEPRFVADPKLKWEMMVKLIDLKTQSLAELEAVSKVQTSISTQPEYCPRHFAEASRDLRRAVDWFLRLRQQKL